MKMASVEFETVKAEEVKFGRNSFIEIARKVAKTQEGENEFIAFVKPAEDPFFFRSPFFSKFIHGRTQFESEAITIGFQYKFCLFNKIFDDFLIIIAYLYICFNCCCICVSFQNR